MNKLLLPVAFLIVLCFSAGCKKCFKCVNECVLCTRIVNNHAFYDTLCTDSYNTRAEYDAAYTLDTTIGYTCATTTPTYQYEFCATKAGEEMYLNYFNKGKKATCNEK